MNRTQVSQADGRAAAVIRPACPADLPALSDFFTGLSAQTRYLRFFGPVTPTPALLHLLSGQAADVHAVVAVAGGVIVGHAMASDRPEPADQPEPADRPQPADWPGPGDRRDPGPARTTDIGVVVADAWQGRGVGAALMRALVGQAEARGVTSLSMDVLHVNRPVLAMILGHWPGADIDHCRDSLGIMIRLPRHQPERPPAPLTPQEARPLVTVAG